MKINIDISVIIPAFNAADCSSTVNLATKWVEHISLKICLVSLINFAGYGLLLCRYHWEKVRQITKGRDKARGGVTFVIVADCRLSAKPSALQSNLGP